MKIALASVRIIDRDINYNLSQMENYMKVAKELGANLICFGEAFLQGFNVFSWNYKEDKKIALPIFSQEFTQIKTLTKDIGIDVLFGYVELSQNNIYSSCALIANGEIIHNYRRISKGWKVYAKTDEHYKEGYAVNKFYYKGRSCVIGLCGDIWDYPERFSLDEDLLLWPVYVCWSKQEWENDKKYKYAKQAELCCGNTLYINSICDGDSLGGAAQFTNGSIQSELPIGNEALLIVNI